MRVQFETANSIQKKIRVLREDIEISVAAGERESPPHMIVYQQVVGADHD